MTKRLRKLISTGYLMEHVPGCRKVLAHREGPEPVPEVIVFGFISLHPNIIPCCLNGKYYNLCYNFE